MKKNTNSLFPAGTSLAAGMMFVFSIDYTHSGGLSPELQKENLESLPIISSLIPAGQFGRHKMAEMVPRYITIHSTHNFAPGADAAAHARLLQKGGLTSRGNSLGFLTWHFTVDDKSIHQSLPTNEQGQHADYEGPGNKSSIGIEMCENSGSSREKTLELTARLTAKLMRENHIPISNVVPHQHWPRIKHSDQKDVGQKNCPHFLMDDGKPGAKWQAFLDQVQSHLRPSSLPQIITD